MEIGEIQKSVQEAEGEPTPLKEKLDEFGTLLTKVMREVYAACTLWSCLADPCMHLHRSSL